MIVSENIYEMTKASYRRLKIRVDLLSFSYRIIGNMEGNIISGSIKIDANADIRRTADISLVVTDSSFTIGEDKKIWLDKYIQIYVGMLDSQNNAEWINMGIYLIDNPSMVYNAENHTLSFQAYDLMSKMTGLRNGQLPGVPVLIPAGASIRGSMASAVSQLGGFNNFIIQDNTQDVPYDIQIETGGYVYDIISKLRDISSNWETFFDINGIFHYQPIDAYYSDEIIADNNLFDYVLTDITQKVDFENVKNVIEVFGKSISPDRYGNVATLSGSTYSITLENFTTLTPSLLIGFTTPSNNGNVNNVQLQINDFDPLPLLNEDGTPVSINESDTYFVVMNQSKFVDDTGDPASADFNAMAIVSGNMYNLTIPGLTAWTEGTIINMTVPSLTLTLNNGISYTITGSDVNIPNAGEICYIRITGANTAQFISSTATKYQNDYVTASGLTYNINISSIDNFSIGDTIMFTAPYIEKSPNIQINNNLACQIYDSTGENKINLIQQANHAYKIKIPINQGLLYLGHQQIYATASDTNPESPYYIEKDIGEIRLILKDGEYNNIYTDQLALERANYELYLHCRMEDSIDLTMVPVYWLDVNKKISINMAGINAIYVTKSIQIDLSPTGTMQVNAIKFYPDIEEVVAPIVLSNIEVTTVGETGYVAGDTFSLAGYVITATYSDNTTADVTDSCTFSPSGQLTADDISVTITYTEDGISKSASQAITVTQYRTMGVSIDLTNSNPATCITYTDDAVGMTAGSSAWDTFFGHYPCMLKNGVEGVKLNPNNFAQDIDGNAVNLASDTAGDVMIAFPRRGLKIETSGNTLTIKMTDKPNDSNFEYNAHTRVDTAKDVFYLGAYKGYVDNSKLRSWSGKTPTRGQTIGAFRTLAKANGASNGTGGSGYDQSGFYQLTYRQAMYLLKYKNLNSQSAVGMGYVGATSVRSTGTTNANGMDYGTTSSSQQMKLFGLEDFWGNAYEYIDGLFNDLSRNILTATDGFNDTGSGYTNNGQGSTSNIGNYMTKPQGGTKTGFIPKQASGSSSTYFCDQTNLVSSSLACFGGNWSQSSSAGAFRLNTQFSSSTTDAAIGARLMYL